MQKPRKNTIMEMVGADRKPKKSIQASGANAYKQLPANIVCNGIARLDKYEFRITRIQKTT